MFTAEDCNVWLVQVPIARAFILNNMPLFSTEAVDDVVGQSLAAVWVSLGLTLLAMLLMFLMGMCKCAVN